MTTNCNVCGRPLPDDERGWGGMEFKDRFDGVSAIHKECYGSPPMWWTKMYGPWNSNLLKPLKNWRGSSLE